MDGSATTPKRPRDRVVATLRELVGELHEDGAVDAAASVAFWLLLSIPAAFLAGLALLSLLGDGATSELRRIMLEFVDRVFSSEADELRAAVEGVFDQQRVGLFSVSVLLGIVTLSRGFAGLIRALDVVYDIEDARGFLRLRLLSLGLAIGTLVTGAGSVWLWTVSGSVGTPLVVRAPVAFGVLVVWAATILHIGPNHHTPWRYDVPGAALAAGGWLVVSLGYGGYVSLVGGGNEIVGVAGALLLGMTWLWLVCLLLLSGGELNEIIARRAGVIVDPPTWRLRIRRFRVSRRDRGQSELP